ncbi:MAG: hypothetical protein AAF587_15265 [Bacteroidota bacterium]
MSLDELSHLWKQSDPKHAPIKSREELQKVLTTNIQYIDSFIHRNNREILFYALFELVLGAGLWWMILEAISYPNKWIAGLELFLIYAVIIGFVFLLKYRLRFDTAGTPLRARLLQMIRQIKRRMRVELIGLMIFLPLALLGISLINPPDLSLMIGLTGWGLLYVCLIAYLIMGGLIWSGYQRPLHELRQCLDSWEEMSE